MGNSFSNETYGTEDDAAYDNALFVASCRRSLNEYNCQATMLLVRFAFTKKCPNGYNCPFLASEEHGAVYAHDSSISSDTFDTIIVWVHGFRQSLDKVRSVASHLLARVRQSQKKDTAVIAFLWPCHERGYMRARAEADGEAAYRLATLLKQLSMADPSRRIIVVAHSLGCRLACRALQDHDCGRCHHLLLLAAAMDNGALMSPRGEFDHLLFPAGCLIEKPTVAYSRHDDVLRKHFNLGELLSGSSLSTPLGLTGPSADTSIDRFHAIDCSSDVASHHAHAWLLSPSVQLALNSILKHSPIPSSFTANSSVCSLSTRRLKLHENYFALLSPSTTARTNSKDKQAEPSGTILHRQSPSSVLVTDTIILDDDEIIGK